jgi:hypothetical protein
MELADIGSQVGIRNQPPPGRTTGRTRGNKLATDKSDANREGRHSRRNHIDGHTPLCIVYTHHMSKRLQVLLDADEWEQLQEIARRHRTTVSEWVRRTLREAREREPGGDLDTKLGTIRAAARHEFPTADIDQMLQEIDSGQAALPGTAL